MLTVILLVFVNCDFCMLLWSRHAIDIVDSGFKDYAIDKQDFLGDEDRMKRVLALIPDENILNVSICLQLDIISLINLMFYWQW